MKRIRILSEDKLNQIIEEHVSSALEEESHKFEWEVLWKQANLATLQSQINPHFLYNTLECIRGMALIEGQEKIADIAWSLSRFFRYSISGSSDIVSLNDELENIRHYTKIQNYRFQDRFKVMIQDGEMVLDAMLPKLTLQPVVENAILHGLADIIKDGVITVKVEKVGNDVKITVSDNGCGMTVVELDMLIGKINGRQTEEEEEGNHTGIGMRNVDRRLKLYFGPEYGISIYSCKNAGTDVEIRIPYQPSPI